jgi:CubicO group peptidase (beta-lactamase class C family)
MMACRIVVTVAILALAIGPRTDVAAQSTDRARAARAVIESAGRTLPALSAAVAQGEALVWRDAVGWADVTARRPASTTTTFPVYSLAKIWTGAAAARLAERGGLDPSMPVQRWLPAFPESEVPMTPMHLATHRSGIRHYRDEAEATLARHCGSPRDALPLFEKDPLLFAPGSSRSYSSWGFVVLSAILETVANAPFEQVMQREIFTPAKMEHTHPADPARPKSHQAISVSRGADGSWQPLPSLDLTCKAGAGGYASTPSDAARFYIALMQGTLVGPTFRPLLLQQDGTGTVEESGRGLGGTALVLVKPDAGLVVSLATSTDGAYDTLAAAARELAAVFAGTPDP